MQFFHGFSLDTLLGIVSCLLGAAALIIGSKAYHNCNIMKGSMNDDKVFNDSSGDYSQRAGGDIINNTCDTNMLSTLTAANFQASLNKAYEFFEQQSAANLQSIIEKTNQIVQEHKPNFAGLTKIDWINIYFESAKTISDEFMQNIWAGVLAKELETPGSFSFKTLDILKNLSSEDFRLFEKMLLLQVEGFVLQKEVESNQHLHWTEFQILREHGLINLEDSKRTTIIGARRTNLVLIGEKYALAIKNETEQESSIEYAVYLLSTAAKEISQILSIDYSLESALTYARLIKDAVKGINGVTVSLHLVNLIIEKADQPGQYDVNYQIENLLG